MNRPRIYCLIFFIFLTPVISYADPPGNPEFYKKDLYRVSLGSNGQRWIESQGKKVADLKDFYFHRYSQEKGGSDKDTLVLVSQLGFSFHNIPLDNTYFFNEALATFLEAERYLPVIQKWFTEHELNVAPLEKIKFRFPTKPVIDKDGGYTIFANTRQSDKNSPTYWVLGLQDLPQQAIVTYGYQDTESVVVHEYFHLCGYNGNHEDIDFPKLAGRKFLEELVKKQK